MAKEQQRNIAAFIDVITAAQRVYALPLQLTWF
jgi:hypothetical protein